MIDLNKSYEYFQPEKVTERIHIVGCGSVGATVAENLARLGLTKFTLWDFDKVCSHNLANQIFRQQDIGELKVDALLNILKEINPDIEKQTKLEKNGWSGQKMSGYIFLAVDDIEIRRAIVEQHFNNMNVKAVFDFRTLLESAQHYAAPWDDYREKDNLLKSMQFSNEEAEDATPVSACGTTLGVAPTVRCICAFGVANFVNYIRGKGLHRLIIADVFSGLVDVF